LGFFGLFWQKTRKNGSGRNGTPPYGTNFLKRDGFLALNFSMARLFVEGPPGQRPSPRRARLERRRGLALGAKTRFLGFFGLFWQKTRKNGSGRNGTPPIWPDFAKKRRVFGFKRILWQRTDKKGVKNLPEKVLSVSLSGTNF
jgi:hypothetical protein